MLTHDGQWRCYEVSNVLVMPNCPDILYSTRVMKRLHGLTHDFDGGQIKLPSVRRQSASQVNIDIEQGRRASCCEHGAL